MPRITQTANDIINLPLESRIAFIDDVRKKASFAGMDHRSNANLSKYLADTKLYQVRGSGSDRRILEEHNKRRPNVPMPEGLDDIISSYNTLVRTRSSGYIRLKNRINNLSKASIDKPSFDMFSNIFREKNG